MKKPGGPAVIAAQLSFNGGFVDTAGFLGLAGLFTAHVTGNFVTLGAALVLGSHGIIGKILALPEFILVVALARLAGAALRVFMIAEIALLLAFFLMAVAFGPFPDPDSPAALLTSFAGIAAMALQNAFQRVHLSSLPPTTLMTGNTTQATIDAVDLIMGTAPAQTQETRARFARVALSIFWFALGCALSATLYWLVGFWCLGIAVLVGVATAAMRVDGKR